ncbi:ferritin-like domain-containing protein [Fuchsiella alkaliacetigena]|uniref:ferritin-like domain-containing protein n=1 Tax=Fuchsiella alkaliacetigena TaxID=957042 RepID=UPI00200A04E9|nr:ferritin-like domain-containing protein [Fuchsiella alkaliacetigena]MCK8823707.1 ferritin-like domain-containing protein [Fuchsiella alkaliacetigena]
MKEMQQKTTKDQDIELISTNMSNFEGTFNLDKSGFDQNLPGHTTEHKMIMRQEPRTVKEEGVGIGLPQDVRLEMAQMLDDHQCALTVALHQYNKHHWLTEGAEAFHSLHHLLDEHRDKTQDHIDMVGERVARLGCVPTAHPVTQHELSYLKHEVEGRYTMRDYLRNDLEHELKIQEMMRQTISRAHQLEDYGTAEVLQEVLLDREDFGYHILSVLEDDTLVRGMNHLLDENQDLIRNQPANSEDKLQ